MEDDISGHLCFFAMPSLTRIWYEQKLQFFLDRNSDTELTIISRHETESSEWGVSLFDFRTLRTEFCLGLRNQQSLKGYKHYIGFSRSLKAPRITYNPWKVIFLHGIRLRAGSYFKVTPRVTHARERLNRANEFIVTSLFAIALAEKRTGPQILRENADRKQFTMGCSMYFRGEMWQTESNAT